jgi:hypothetical protein
MKGIFTFDGVRGAVRFLFTWCIGCGRRLRAERFHYLVAAKERLEHV